MILLENSRDVMVGKRLKKQIPIEIRFSNALSINIPKLC